MPTHGMTGLTMPGPSHQPPAWQGQRSAPCYQQRAQVHPPITTSTQTTTHAQPGHSTDRRTRTPRPTANAGEGGSRQPPSASIPFPGSPWGSQLEGHDERTVLCRGEPACSPTTPDPSHAWWDIRIACDQQKDSATPGNRRHGPHRPPPTLALAGRNPHRRTRTPKRTANLAEGGSRQPPSRSAPAPRSRWNGLLGDHHTRTVSWRGDPTCSSCRRMTWRAADATRDGRRGGWTWTERRRTVTDASKSCIHRNTTAVEETSPERESALWDSPGQVLCTLMTAPSPWRQTRDDPRAT